MALEKLRQTVRLDTDFIDAYIKIGDILREQNEADKAIKIHRDLLIRPSLSQKQRMDILKSLSQDFVRNKQLKNALVVVEQLLDLDSKNEWAKDLQLSIYEQMGDWQGAYDIVRKSHRLSKDEKKFRMAAYKFEQGVQLSQLKKEHDARLRFREAIKEEPSFVPAHLNLADSYIRENRADDALIVLKKFIQSNPHYSDTAFTRLRQVLFDLGHYGDIQKVFIDLTKNHPEIIQGHLGLAEIYEKKGEFLRAVDICQKAIKENPHHLEPKFMLVRLYTKLDRHQAAADLAVELANTFTSGNKKFVCAECGQITDHYFYRCANCRSWNTMIKN